MNLKEQLSSYAHYNAWANQKLLTWLSDQSIDLLGKEHPSSYSSILKTLNHIWGTEAYWFGNITEDNTMESRYGVQELDKQEIFDGLIKRSKLIAEKITTYSEHDLCERIKVVSPWFEANQTRADYLQHLVNHSTYHRGQVVTIGRNVGITGAPMTDYLFYVLEMANK
jgi:uncharacterized damage-inducible protein DinB